MGKSFRTVDELMEDLRGARVAKPAAGNQGEGAPRPNQGPPM